MSHLSRKWAFTITVLLISGAIISSFPVNYRAETELEADLLEISSDRTVAEGNVRLTRPSWSLTCNYLELKGEAGTDGVKAKGNVNLKSDKFTASAERLSGELAEVGSDESVELTLIKASGKSGPVSFAGEEIGLTIEKGELNSLRIRSNAELSLDENSTLTGDKILATKSEPGWDFEVTGDPGYETESTSLRAERIAGKITPGPENSSQDGTVISRGITAEGDVQFLRPNWSLNTDFLELKKGGGMEKLSAEGDTKIDLGDNSSLSGGKLEIEKSERGWDFEISENSELRGETTSLQAETIAGTLSTDTEGDPEVSGLTARGIAGRIELADGKGERRKIQFLGKSADLDFDGSSTLSRVDLSESSFSSCEGCQCNGCAYSVSADRTTLIDRELVLARSATLKSFGIPINWSPLFFLPLKDVGLPRRPYFPRVGYASEEGVTLSGAFPVYFDKNHYGNVLVDYFSRQQGLGLGVDYYSGSGPITGVGEIYGTYRFFGESFFRVDGTFSADSLDRVEITTDLEIEQGPFRGTNYDQNEWSLILSGNTNGPSWKALVSRTEKPENEEKTEHIIKKLPEISLSREKSLELLSLSYGLRTSLGYYREDKTDWSAVRSGGRGKIGGNLNIEPPSLGSLTFSFEGEGWGNPYYLEQGEGVTTRAWMNLEPELAVEGPGTLSLQFIHRDVFGESPFDFDRVERRDQFNFDYESSLENINQNLSFHYDFVPDDGFSNARYEVGFSRKSLDQKFTVNYDISGTTLSSIKTNSTYSRGKFELNLSSGYNFAGSSITQSMFGLEFSSESAVAGIRLKSIPFETWLEKVSGKLELEFLDSWSLSLKGKYDIQAGKLDLLSYTLHHTIQNCLTVGITGTKSEFWFDMELVGF